MRLQALPDKHLSIAGAVMDVAWLARVLAVGPLCIGRDITLVALSKGSHEWTLDEGEREREGSSTLKQAQ